MKSLYPLFRWLLFIVVGLPVQLIVYAIYPFVAIYFYLFIKNKVVLKPVIYNPRGNLDNLIFKSRADKIRDRYFLDNQDDHGSLTHLHWGLEHNKHLAEGGLEALVTPDGSLSRREPNKAWVPESIDVLAAWIFSYITSGIKRPDLVTKVAKHYLKYCLGLNSNGRGVTTRCSNSGLNHTFDGDYHLNLPAFGQAYYASAALFALAYKETSGINQLIWACVYGLNYLIMGGWLWGWAPVLRSKKHSLYYVQHITMLCLYSINRCMSKQTKSMEKVMDLTYRNINPFFYALYLDSGGKSNPIDLRLAVNGLLSMQGDNAFVWQRYPSGDDYFDVPLATSYSHLAFPAKLLKPFVK